MWRQRQAARTITVSAHPHWFMRWVSDLSFLQIFLIFFVTPIVGLLAWIVISILWAYATGWNIWLCFAWVAFWMLFVAFYRPLRKRKLRIEAEWRRRRKSADW